MYPATLNQSTYSDHSLIRLQQRNIPRAAVDLLLDFAEPIKAGDGSVRYAFGKREWRRAAAYLGGQAKYFERFRNAYAIVGSNGQVITAAWKH